MWVVCGEREAEAKATVFEWGGLRTVDDGVDVGEIVVVDDELDAGEGIADEVADFAGDFVEDGGRDVLDAGLVRRVCERGDGV